MITYSIIQQSRLEGANRLDAEYYQPEYLQLVNDLVRTSSYKSWNDIKGKFITGPFGSEFNVENYVTEGKYRYVRGKDVKEFIIAENDNVYIPEKDFERLKKYSLDEGDILTSVVGTLGIAAIVNKSSLPAIFSCKSTAFRTDDINPYYFITYLNSKYGHNLLLRSMRGHVQTGLNIGDLKSLLVFIPPKEEQERIGRLFLSSQELLNESKLLYNQSEKLFLQELGLADFQNAKDLSFEVNFLEVQEVNRMDADYFQPKYEKLLDTVTRFNGKKLADLVSMRKGFEPGSEEYQEEGKLFIRVSSLSINGLDDKDQKYLSDDTYNELKNSFEPKVGEILLTKDATPGIAFVLKESIEGIISGGILRLKTKQDLDPEYTALCINSVVGRMQAEHDVGGSIIVHWRPDQIKNVLIPILPISTQQKIGELVRKSHEARKKSKELLEEAKRKVEEMIEKGVN